MVLNFIFLLSATADPIIAYFPAATAAVIVVVVVAISTRHAFSQIECDAKSKYGTYGATSR